MGLIIKPFEERAKELLVLIQAVESWSINRKLHHQDPKMQIIKLLEEFGELARAILKYDNEMTIDSLGDMLVVLIILHQQMGLELTNTLGHAWNEIKDRQGKIVDGVFIKEEDLK